MILQWEFILVNVYTLGFMWLWALFHFRLYMKKRLIRCRVSNKRLQYTSKNHTIESFITNIMHSFVYTSFYINNRKGKEENTLQAIIWKPHTQDTIWWRLWCDPHAVLILLPLQETFLKPVFWDTISYNKNIVDNRDCIPNFILKVNCLLSLKDDFKVILLYFSEKTALLFSAKAFPTF